MLFYLHLCSLYALRSVGKGVFLKRVSCCFPRLRDVRVTLHDQLIRWIRRKKYTLDIPRKNIYPNVVCIDDLIRHFIKPIICRSRNEPLFFFIFFSYVFFTTLYKYSDKTINYIYRYRSILLSSFDFSYIL